MRLPARRESPKEKSSSGMRGRNLACAVLFPPRMPRLENCFGELSQCPAILRADSNRKHWRAPRRPGTESGGWPAVVAHRGIPSCMTRDLISFTWEGNIYVSEILLNQIWVLSPDGSQRILIANKDNAPPGQQHQPGLKGRCSLYSKPWLRPREPRGG